MGKRVNSVEGGRHCKCKNDNYDKGHLRYNAEMISASLTAAVSHVTLALQNEATFKIGGYFYIWISPLFPVFVVNNMNWLLAVTS